MSEGQWFVSEVQPHERTLRTYLRGSFPSVRDVDDIVQESYFRLLRARTTRQIPSARAYLFRVARNFAIDIVRRDRISPVETVDDLAAVSAFEERTATAELLTHEEKSHLLGEALAALPGKCREIVFLHKIKGYSQRAVAAQLGLSEKTVANQIGHGVKRCEQYLRRKGVEFF